MLNFRITDHLIIPFGVPKWDIDKIRITGVSTTATFFESETPIAYIDKNKKRPLILADYKRLWHDLDAENPRDKVIEIFKRLAGLCDRRSSYERRWLFSYFCAMFSEFILWGPRLNNEESDDYFFFAKMPLPQAHLYLEDPLLTDRSYEKIRAQLYRPTPPDYMVKVDFAFWTGEKLVAVEIDGSEPQGYENDVRRDRRLRRAGVDVIHILNSEVVKFGEQTIACLLPGDIGKLLSEYELKNIWQPSRNALFFASTVKFDKKPVKWIPDYP